MVVSRTVEERWRCPACSRESTATVHEIVDATEDPATYAAILDDTFNNLTCAAGHVLYAVRPVLIHVPELKTLVFFAPSHLPIEQQDAAADRLMDFFRKSVPRFERYMEELPILCPSEPCGYDALRDFLADKEESRPVARVAPAAVSDDERRLSALMLAATKEPDLSRQLELWRQLSVHAERTTFSTLRGMALSGIGTSLMKLAARDSTDLDERQRHWVAARQSLMEAAGLFDPAVDPEQWAIAKLNLAETLRMLGDDSWDSFTAQAEQYLPVVTRLQREVAPDERGVALKRLRGLMAPWLHKVVTLESAVYEALGSICGGVVRLLDDEAEREETIRWLYLQGRICMAAPPPYATAGDDAAVAYTQLLQLLQRDDNPELWAVTQQNLAAAQNRARKNPAEVRHRRALRALEACLEVYTKAAFPEKHEENSRNLGRAAFLLGQRLVESSNRGDQAALVEAESALNLACVQFAEYGPDNEFVLAATALGNLARQIPGDQHEHNERALHLYLMALEKIDKEADPQLWAALTLNLGVAQADRTHMEVGQFEYLHVEKEPELPGFGRLTIGGGLSRGLNLSKAAASFEAALSVFTADAYPKDWAVTSSYLATVRLELARERVGEEGAEQQEAGIQLLREVVAFLQPLEYPDVLRDARLFLAGAYAERAGGNRRENLAQSIQLYRALVQDGASIKISDRLNYQRALLKLGEDEVLGELAGQAIHIAADPLATPFQKRDAFSVCARACDMSGARVDAVDHYEAAIRYADQIFADSETTASRNLANIGAVQLYRAAVGCLVGHEAAIPDAHLRRAFLLGGRMHARLLDAALAFAPSAPPKGLPEGLATRERDLLDAYRREWAAVDEFKKTDERINAVNRMVATRRALEACWRDMDACPGAAPYLQQRRNEPIGWRDVATWLAGTECPTAFVEFICLQETLIAIVARSGAEEPVLYRWPLPYEDLRQCADRFTETFAELDAYDDIPEAGWLEELVPVAHALHAACAEGTRLLVMPDGPLHGLPLHSIAIDGAPLLAHHGVVYLSSLADTVRHSPVPERTGWRRRFLESRDKRVFVAGDPTGDLPQAADEARAVARALGVRAVSGASITKPAVIEALRSKELVHIAGHAEFHGLRAIDGGLVLSGGTYLSGFDMLVESFGCDLLVLASCSSARQRLSSSGDLMGLSRACLSAGVGRILCAQWPVEDAVARRFMQTFYSRLDQGGDASAAVRVAALQLVAEGLHPYLWAPFVLYGRPQSRVSSI